MTDPKGKQHTCSRGHTYTGPGPCPVCWPGGAKRSAKERETRK